MNYHNKPHNELDDLERELLSIEAAREATKVLNRYHNKPAFQKEVAIQIAKQMLSQRKTNTHDNATNG
jgi:hypothetical protein